MNEIAGVVVVLVLVLAGFAVGFVWASARYKSQCQMWADGFAEQTERFQRLDETYKFLDRCHETEKLFREFDKDYQQWLAKELARTERKYLKLWKKQMKRSMDFRPYLKTKELRTVQLCIGQLIGQQSGCAANRANWRRTIVNKSRQCPPLPLP